MLVITRKPNEGIMISDNIEITILEIAKDRVKIGVNAPKDIKIIRHELLVAEKENVAASKAVSPNTLEALLNTTMKGNK